MNSVFGFILLLSTVAVVSGVGVPQGPCIGGTCNPGFTCINDECFPDTPLTTTTTTTTASTCVDRGTTDCTNNANLCNNSIYFDLMTQQCPRTCNRCSGVTTTRAACVDKAATNGVSDCPQLAYLCNNQQYYTLMTQQCPRTCGRCPSG